MTAGNDPRYRRLADDGSSVVGDGAPSDPAMAAASPRATPGTPLAPPSRPARDPLAPSVDDIADTAAAQPVTPEPDTGSAAAAPAPSVRERSATRRAVRDFERELADPLDVDDEVLAEYERGVQPGMVGGMPGPGAPTHGAEYTSSAEATEGGPGLGVPGGRARGADARHDPYETTHSDMFPSNGAHRRMVALTGPIGGPNLGVAPGGTRFGRTRALAASLVRTKARTLLAAGALAVVGAAIVGHIRQQPERPVTVAAVGSINTFNVLTRILEAPHEHLLVGTAGRYAGDPDAAADYRRGVRLAERAVLQKLAAAVGDPEAQLAVASRRVQYGLETNDHVEIREGYETARDLPHAERDRRVQRIIALTAKRAAASARSGGRLERAARLDRTSAAAVARMAETGAAVPGDGWTDAVALTVMKAINQTADDRRALAGQGAAMRDGYRAGVAEMVERFNLLAEVTRGPRLETDGAAPLSYRGHGRAR